MQARDAGCTADNHPSSTDRRPARCNRERVAIQTRAHGVISGGQRADVESSPTRADSLPSSPRPSPPRSHSTTQSFTVHHGVHHQVGHRLSPPAIPRCQDRLPVHHVRSGKAHPPTATLRLRCQPRLSLRMNQAADKQRRLSRTSARRLWSSTTPSTTRPMSTI